MPLYVNPASFASFGRAQTQRGGYYFLTFVAAGKFGSGANNEIDLSILKTPSGLFLPKEYKNDVPESKLQV